MSLTRSQLTEIENVLRTALRNKFQNYHPEPAAMPFHTRLLGKDRLALYSFIHSLNTSFGESIYEPVALALAKGRFKVAKSQATAGEKISEEAFKVIQDIMNDLTTANASPDKLSEIERLRKVCQSDKMQKVKPTKVDIWLESQTKEWYLFDLKTAKPNAGGFKEFKRTLLEWVATVLAKEPTLKIHT
jgi:type II restriction enzyme